MDFFLCFKHWFINYKSVLHYFGARFIYIYAVSVLPIITSIRGYHIASSLFGSFETLNKFDSLNRDIK